MITNVDSASNPVVAFAGPPCVGKSSVARLVADQTGGRYVNISDLLLAGRRDGWLHSSTPASIGDVDGVPDAVVAPVLAAALDQNVVAAAGVLTVLDDLVTCAAALELLAQASTLRLRIVELDAPDMILLSRAQLQLCPACHPATRTGPPGPDPQPESYAEPEVAQPAERVVCPTCRHPLPVLTAADTDGFLQRLTRYRHHRQAELRSAAARHHIPWTRIEADTPYQCATAITRAAKPAHAPAARPPAPRHPSP